MVVNKQEDFVAGKSQTAHVQRKSCSCVWPADQTGLWRQAAGAGHPDFRPFYAFGDRLSDVGNDDTATFGGLPIDLIYADGRFSKGKAWVQDLAAKPGRGAAKASLLGGNDFAYGGAETGCESLPALNPLNLPGQYAPFLPTPPRRPACSPISPRQCITKSP